MTLPSMLPLIALALSSCTTAHLSAPKTVSFAAADAVTIAGRLYGTGLHGVVLVPGGHGVGESWHLQAQRLAKDGFRVLAMDYRGLGSSQGVAQDDQKTHLDVIGAVRLLQQQGSVRVSIVGASWGGRAAVEAIFTDPASVDRLVLIAPSGFNHPERLTNPTIVIVAANDRDGSGELRLTGIQRQFDQMPGPKRMVVVDGAAHAQFLFLADHGQRVYAEMLRHLRK